MSESLLAFATVVFCGCLFAPALLPRWPLWIRALWRVTTLLLLTFVVQHIFGSPLRPEFHASTPWQQAWQQAVAVGWWVAAARSLADVARLLLMVQNRSRETQILSDLVGGAIYVTTSLAVVEIVFAVPVGGVIATSGVIAVVIGLALQSTLADVFSGIAIDIERPYRAGDVLSVEGGVEGCVREVNWRSTLITTGNGDVAVVPNSVMAKARLVNHSLPAPLRRASIEIRLDPRIMPERCREALDAAVQACRLPLIDPPPAVAQTALRGDGAVYEIGFSVSSAEALSPARAEMLALVQRHLFHAAIPLAVDGHTEVPSLTPPTATDLLAWSDLFGILAEAERETLAARMSMLHLVKGQILFEQGDAAEALLIVASGTVGIQRRNLDGTEHAYRVSPGMALGAISLITEAPYAVAARALTPVKVFRLDRAAITACLAERPSLMEGLEELARRGQAAISADLAAARNLGDERSDVFLTRMRGFLRRLATDVKRGALQ